MARGDLTHGGSLAPRRPREAARAASAAASADHARPARDTHGGLKRDRAAARRVEETGVDNREMDYAARDFFFSSGARRSKDASRDTARRPLPHTDRTDTD